MLGRRDLRLLVWAVVGLMAVAMAVSFIGWSGGWHPDGYGMMGGWMWAPLVLLMMALMFAMMSMGGMHGGHGHSGHGHGEDDARRILDRRYAAGELSREEYQRMRDEIERRP